jgi:Na+/H+ antiporter NhaA
MADSETPVPLFAGATAWARNLTPLRQFLRTETGSAAVLLAATVAALAWVNIDASSYNTLWSTRLSISIGRSGVAQDLHGWVNSGLMTFFFLVVAVEARREFDMGELRQRSRLALPLLAGIGGMTLPIVIYLALNAGRPSVHGWGTAMSTDTAFALGALALVGPRLPDRVRTYLLTFSVVDDLAGIAVIAIVYSHQIRMVPLLTGLAILAAGLVLRFRGLRYGPAYLVLGVAAWIAVFKSGVDPVIVGLVTGLSAYARPAARSDLEQATDLFRLFREQPTAELAESARAGVRAAISPNDRLQQIFHPWTSYVIVPLFALANAGITVSGSFLARAYSSPVTLGILLGYLIGKPAGTAGAAWVVTRVSRGRVQPPIGWAAVAGAGAIAGIGFTVSLLIASLAFSGTDLQEAKLGILSAALCASAASWIVFRLTTMLPKPLQIRALLGTADVITDLAAPVDPDRDHVRGPGESPVTMVEYGDFECPYCGLAEPVVRELLADFGDLRYVWRHLPLTDVHPHAQLAAEAAEAAAAQRAFWPMHDLLLDHQGELTPRELAGYASELGLDTERFSADLRNRTGVAHVAEDVDSADLSGVSGTPTFFINGRRHNGAYDIGSLSAAVRSARARAMISQAEQAAGALGVRLVIVVREVDGGFLGARRARVDPDVTGDEIGLGVRMRPFVLGDQPPGPRLGDVVPGLVVLGRLFFLARSGVRVDVRLLLGQQLIQRFPGLLLGQRVAVAFARRPPVRRDDPGVERVVAGIAFERVRGVQHAFVLSAGRQVVGVVDPAHVIGLVVSHAYLPSRPAQPAATNRWRISPIPSIQVTSSSPGLSQRCGSRPIPTPAGVPVKITSPGSSVTVRDSEATSRGMEKIRFWVRPFCTSSPLIAQPSSRSSGLANSSGVTSHGPIGPKPGNDLPMQNWGAGPASWLIRSETSWPTARPAT